MTIRSENSAKAGGGRVLGRRILGRRVVLAAVLLATITWTATIPRDMALAGGVADMDTDLVTGTAPAVVDGAAAPKASGTAPRRLTVRIVAEQLDRVSGTVLQFFLRDPVSGSEVEVGTYGFFPPARVGQPRDIPLTLPDGTADGAKLVVYLADTQTPARDNASRLRVVSVGPRP